MSHLFLITDEKAALKSERIGSRISGYDLDESLSPGINTSITLISHSINRTLIFARHHLRFLSEQGIVRALL